jgi:hypothetical protein
MMFLLHRSRRPCRQKPQSWLEGKTVRKVIVVPGRLVNIAVS